MNVADVAAADTVTDAGVGIAVLLSEASATVLPPAGAGWVRVTVHVVEAPDTRLVGLHESADTDGLGVTTTIAVVLPPSVAVSVTVCEVRTALLVAENVVELAPAGTVTELGTGSALALSDDSETTVPPLGAGWFSVTVHVLIAPAVTVAGTHTSVDSAGLGVTLTVAVTLAPSVAVTVTVWDVATEPAFAVNVADDEVAGTATD
jgi:hypothetical protein